MPKMSKRMGAVVMVVCLGWTAAAGASTQHYIGKVVSGEGASARVVSTQISYISERPPLGQAEMYRPKEARIFMVDGWYSDRETFLAAVQPGQRLHLRNNRHEPILYALYSTKPFAAEGVILEADPASRTVTVRHMVDRKQRKTVEQTYTLPADGVLRYEGEQATPAEALKRGRHVRAHPARKQTILAITPEAHLQTVAQRDKAWTNLSKDEETWVNEGHFAGYYHNWLFFTGEPFREEGGSEKQVKTYQPGASITASPFSAKALINGNFVTPAAAFRPGGRALYVPDPIHSRRRASHVILHPTDDGHIEGRVRGVNGDELELEVVRTSTGRAEDLRRETLTIPIAEDAKFHLNGKPDAERADALRRGNTVRVLPAWSGAMLVRDLDGEKGKVSGYGRTDRLTTTVEQPATADGPAEFRLHFGQVLFSPATPHQYVDAAFTWKDGQARDLKLSNERFGDTWKVKDVDQDLRFDGENLSGWLEGHFSGGSLGGYGRVGVYRFHIEARVRNNVISGRIRKMTVDGKDAADIEVAHVGALDDRVGGTVTGPPAKGETGLYRMVLHGGDEAGPVVYLPRDKEGWGEGLAIVSGNRRTDAMAVDASRLDLSSDGLSGSLRIRLTPAMLPNVSQPTWKTYRITTERSGQADGEGGPRFTGKYRMRFGDAPVLWIGPDGRVVRDVDAGDDR